VRVLYRNDNMIKIGDRIEVVSLDGEDDDVDEGDVGTVTEVVNNGLQTVKVNFDGGPEVYLLEMDDYKKIKGTTEISLGDN